MRSLLRPLAVVLAVGMLVGCTPSPQVSPSTEVTVPSVSITPTPTPQWTEDEQGAVDAVQRYLQVWTDIGQNLDDADWTTILEVAGDPAANDAQLLWAQWAGNGWHLVGGPSFIPDQVTQGALDSQGQRYHVHGCYIITGGYLADEAGDPVGNRGVDRGPSEYLVLNLNGSKYLVLEDTAEDGTC